MAAPAWMPLYVADYLADTGHLSTVEHGAYMLLIMHYWQNGGIPDEDPKLARICRLSVKEWLNIKETLADLFSSDWTHKRIDEEIAKTSETMDKRSTAGRTAGLASAAARRRNVQRTLNDAPNDDATIVERSSTPPARGLPSPPPSVPNGTAPADPETELFRRGRDVLGKDAGGMVAKLLKAKGGRIHEARSAIEMASGKSDPREYVGAIIRGVANPTEGVVKVGL